ncbi:5,10-methylene-tetrahydrofolate dehydrogenase [Virgibacillus sp. W0430]|uniref:5,10-methylene-tetrahydrofolate dehydrogenase n=1 Tax=Virgibacillus sp. W0430 TaxID=3391580 RepID=UPI003F47F178
MQKNLTIGLITAPGLATDVANTLMDNLPEALSNSTDQQLSFNIENCVNSTVGAVENKNDIFSETYSYVSDKNLDFAITITDFPLIDNGKVITCDIHPKERAAILSLPALGWILTTEKVRTTIIQIVTVLSNDIYSENASETSDQAIDRARKITKWLKYTGENENNHIKGMLRSKLIGKLRLLLGMAFANRPVQIMSSLSNVIAIAFTTGAFGMIFTTMWKLSDVFSWYRLSGLTISAIMAMVFWIIIAHSLWERPAHYEEKKLHQLYNLATILTLLIAVIAYYIALYIIFLITAFILIPPGLFATVLELDNGTSITQYMRIAWFATSISTFASAIGAGLEDEERIRETTYGYRQYWRFKEKEN